MSTPLSPEGYAAAGGSICPVCGSDAIELDMDWEGCNSTSLAQQADCQDCAARWYPVYELTGYEDLTTPESREQETEQVIAQLQKKDATNGQ